MKRFHVTASSLWRAMLCLGSTALERAGSVNEYAERGTKIHAFLESVSRIGRDESLRLAFADDREAMALINTDRLPLGTSYAAEVTFAFDVATGRAQEMGRNLQRDYSSARPTEICGTADVVALLGDDAVYVADYKTGHKQLASPEANWQFKFLGLAAARAYGRDRAVVEMIRIGTDGEPYKIGGELGLFDLAEIAEQVRELWMAGTKAATSSDPPPLTTGAHCSGCASISFCPAATAMVRSLHTDVVEVAHELDEDLARHASKAVDTVEALEAFVKRLREQLDDYASVHPITLPDGRVYGPVEKSRSTPEGPAVWHLLKERIGEEEAWKAVKMSSTWTAIKDVARALAAKDGRKATHVEKEIRDELYARKAVKTSFFTSVTAHKPKELKL